MVICVLFAFTILRVLMDMLGIIVCMNRSFFSAYKMGGGLSLIHLRCFKTWYIASVVNTVEYQYNKILGTSEINLL